MRQYVASLELRPTSAGRDGVVRYDSGVCPGPGYAKAKRLAHAVLTATGYSLPEARSAELAQEQLERARQLVFEQHGFKMPRL